MSLEINLLLYYSYIHTCFGVSITEGYRILQRILELHIEF